ncbi:MAG: aminodeoxychorismate lyase [Gammaproteobacteria bacterium]
MIIIDAQETDQISLTDRGLHYADGLFETIAVSHGQAILADAHLSRLSAGADRLGITVPDWRQVEHTVHSSVAGVERGVLKLILTRGSGGRGYRPPTPAEPRLIHSLHDWPDFAEAWYQQGVRIRWCQTPVSRNARLAGMKHMARLENVLARGEWSDPEIAEGLMLDDTGCVIEGTSSNLFVVDAEGIKTPELSHAGVAGVMRGWIMSALSDSGRSVIETSLRREDIEQAQEVFLTNSVIGLWPVRQIGEHHLAPGSVARSIQTMIEGLGGGVWGC